MSITDDPNDQNHDPNESPNVRKMRERINELEARAKRADELEALEAARQRQSLVSEAGLTLNDAQRKALETVHEGDWTKEAILRTATSLGFPVPAPAPDPVADDLAAHQRVAQVTAGAGGLSSAPLSEDQEFDARLAAAKTEDEVLALYRGSGRAMA